MPACVVKLCRNNTTRNKKDSGITYHQFPTDPVICARWTAAVQLSREASWKPGKRSVICSAHFNDTDFYDTKGGLKRLSKGAIPKNALVLSSTQPDDSSDDSEVTVEPDVSTILTSNVTPEQGNLTEINYLFDSPTTIKLKQELIRKNLLQKKHGRIIKTLRERTRRLKKTIFDLKSTVASLKQEQLRYRYTLIKRVRPQTKSRLQTNEEPELSTG